MREGAAIALGLALREDAQVGDFGAGKKRRGGVGAGGDAGSAADAGGGVHGAVGDLFGDGDGVAVGSAAGGDGDVAAGGDDAVEGAAVDHQVLDDGEGVGAPGLQVEFVAVFEVAHGELADRGGAKRAVGFAVDHEAAGAADAFAAIVFESDGVVRPSGSALVQHVEHLKQGHVGVDIVHGIADELARCLCGRFSVARSSRSVCIYL